MCGINGIIVHKYDDSISDKIESMNTHIIHRGPDDDGTYIEKGDTSVALGMRRLSIIDLSTGKQPIKNENDDIIIVFNGEIYNYLVLKNELLEEGSTFNTNSDTEVILRLYERYGIDSFHRLDGMYAFAIYDKRNNKIILARDFFGEKPLYYYQTDSVFYWASELKSIVNVVEKTELILSQDALKLFFQLTYIPAPYTIYESVYKLEPNTVLVLDLVSKETSSTTIYAENKSEYNDLSWDNACKICFQNVNESVMSRAIADVPIGTFLSGGVDSSIVSWALANNTNTQIDTFSIGFKNKKFDESEKAKIVAKLINSNHHEFTISEIDLYEHIDDILLNFDEPFADSSALATYLVAQKARSTVKAVLTGDGGDEVFGGYNKYYIGKFNSAFTNIMPSGIFPFFKNIASPLLKVKTDNRGYRFKIKKLLEAIDYDRDFYYKIISLGFSSEEVLRLLADIKLDNPIDYYKNKLNISNNNLHSFRLIDRFLSLEGDMLVKVDRTSMLASLECRSPFLNKKMWDFTNQLPENYLIKGFNKKYLLKKSFEQYFPTNFFEQPKQGFGVPVGDWLREGLKNELLDYIDDDFLREQNIFNQEYIKIMVHNHINKKEDNTFKVWTFFCFQKWYKNIYMK
ncbi:asparagine synthase (glutamine-hydrolyzing) [Dysgonomonas sp. PFB1-18]|uniref:asparagine synthase (glutamine-hydrolyzing) n=1 Tax=unclassified Dysgonomonas TaxID=2630389 RepID=UPI002476FF9F|nr:MULTISPECIES: asparagine synthase (glutamine-hydrolyzing) [unclassified Dysgonomonas]MDH6307768.1 asparagine synthase (glutamine-hydrolyzing) [Dysgonomonas sp. PF1-14]MDH6337686.1 asparagine synthase (glutamine-hydrolyzing) [Dysgonomonas sp. PF1-16]MDH6378910.1 asparagine synthase (glutamine-hydrolyzing) [Dysgonomonas sp. PFB1-18]MDH6396545.1 asparagine synthase (glutamine-hydrolyzing) [Dysgonomonas sp. PF1-23]